MSPSNPLTDNAIGRASTALRIIQLDRAIPARADMRLGPISATGKSGVIGGCPAVMNVLGPKLEYVRADQ
jgi:hypothetical protein